MATNKEWTRQILGKISEDPEAFYQHFLPDTTIEQVGGSIRLQPCPICGHMDCCTATPGEVAINCFSPGCFSGQHLRFISEVLGYSPQLLADIGTFYSVPYYHEEVVKEDPAVERMYIIRDIAAKWYTKQLFEDSQALTYQVKTRGHDIETLKLFDIGLSKDFLGLRTGLLELGYSEDEIKEAKVWIPENIFVYPYRDTYSKRVIRFNTKNPFKSVFTFGDNAGKEIMGFSVGNKYMYTTPTLSYSGLILVEGENDLLTLYEHGAGSVMAIGGKLSEEQLSILRKMLPKFKHIYCMFDNDHAGEEYMSIINDEFPHLNIYSVDYGSAYKDPDEAFRSGTVTLDKVLETAKLMDTDRYHVEHYGNTWNVKNRLKRLEFEITDRSKTGSFVGNMMFYVGDELKDMEYDKTPAKCKFKPLNFFLIAEMDKFFNEDIEERPMEDLLSIYYYTKWKAVVIKRLSEMLFETPEEAREEIVSKYKRTLGEEVTDIILKEVNELQNEEIVDYASIPKMKIGQFYSVQNNDAFMYFTYVKKDNDTIRKLPYLVTNDRQLIRLDLYKRKDDQCLILIRNRYELPLEVPQAIMDLQRISLAQHWVEKYIADEIDSRDLEPGYLIRRIEAFIRRFYYSEDDRVFKVMALWIYGTYAYELFGQYPYLFLNGPKGSGKTILDTCVDLLAFNPRMTVSITNAALFRSISTEGGTLILDEMESLTSRAKSADSDLAAVLKGGYMRSGCAMRCDKDNGNTPQMFDVFGPKVISNIFGLEDVIGDRCIQVNTGGVSFNQMIKLEDPKQVYIDGMVGVRELTSKCALSVLENFQLIYKTFKEKIFETKNARLTQILRPIQALAYIAGPEYERAFVDYYNNSIKVVKEETEYETPEGALSDILKDICMEIMGEAEPNYTSNLFHKYKNPVIVNTEEGWFELDTVHVRTFMEEVTSAPVDSRQVTTWIRRVSPVDMYQRRRRTTVSLNEDDIIREYNGNTRLKVQVYKYYLTDFFPADYVATALEAGKGEIEVPGLDQF